MTNEEAISYFKRSYASGDTDDERQHNEALDMAIKALEQTRPNGTWKEWDTTFGRNIYYCTACGRSLEILYKYDFCPLCGADMREVEE